MIYFYQPVVPSYREAFYDELSKTHEIKVFSSKIDFLNVSSSSNSEYVKYIGGFLNFRNILFWQKNVPFDNLTKNDIVVISGNPRVVNYMLLLVFCRFKGIKTVWWGQGWSAGSRGFFSKIRIKMMHLANAVLLYTDYEKKQINIKNSYALNNGLDSYEIDRSIKYVNIIRSYEVIQKSLVFIGRLTEKANFPFLLKLLSETKCNCSLNVIGSGDKEYEFKKLAEELNVNHRINWFGSLFDEVEIAKVMLRSHAFIYTGAVGLSLIHAFNYGLPALIHDCREQHMPEFAAFLDGYNGLSFSYGDIIDAASKVDCFFSLENKVQQNLSNNAKETIRNSFNTLDMTKRFNELIFDLTSNESNLN